MSKVIDEVVFKKSIEDMLQYLSDNCLYEFVPYDDESIANLFSLTPEEAQKLSDLISDEVVSKYKLWSSSKVNDELLKSKIECNDYTDKMLSNISSISIKYVDTLPTSDISTSTIYILKNTGGGNDTLNLYDGGAWTSIGEFTISLEDFYKKDVMDTKLNEKANKTEVLSTDNILVSTGTETHDNVYSAKLTKTELDKKANDDEVVKKTDIKTTLDQNSTNDDVCGGKAIFDAIIKNIGGGNYSTDEQVVGTWIDGKPVYRKVIVLPSRPVIGTSWKSLGVSVPDIDIIVSVAHYDTVSAAGGTFIIVKNTSPLQGLAPISINVNYLILEYTKTTD